MRYIIFTAVATIGLSGCLLDVLMGTAVQGELQAQNASAAQNALNSVKEDKARMELQRAIDAYYADKGTYPPSLDVLGFNPVPTHPDGSNFGYNPVTGQLLDSDAGPTPADYLLMQDISEAINAYGTASGYYPPTLDTLAETGYLPEPPRTEAGQEFNYNNQNGVFTHPLDGHVSAARPGRTPAAGAGGPMGEAMTGIAIQEELNSQSNAGASAGRSVGAAGINRATQSQNDRQQKALEDLGL